MSDRYSTRYPQDKMTAVVDAVRRIVERWTITRMPLIADANAGDTSISIKSTKRFRVGEQFLIVNAAEDVENQLYILDIPDKTTIVLADANGNPSHLKWEWPLSAGASVIKTQDDMLVKAVFFGEPDIITTLPAITVSMQNRSSEFFTLRSTKERYNIEITAYVSGSTQEEGDRFLSRILSIIQYGLKRNFYPLFNDYNTSPITTDIVEGDTFIKVPDSSIFNMGSNEIIIEDEYNIAVHSIVCIPDSTTIQTYQCIEFDFLQAETTVIKPNRLPYNSWPSDVTFGKIKKGTLLKAGTITYFVEEMEDHVDASFGDTQLS